MRKVHFAMTFAIFCCALQMYAQSAAGVTPSEPQSRVIRSVAGSSGSEQNGRYVISDPRSVFYVPADKHVIVYFEWEGKPGTHHFEGYWKNPDGKVVVIADFSFESKQKRFGGYWTLDLIDTMKPGMWALEARVDGELTGTHTFQVVAAEKPPNLANAPQPLPAADIYKKAVSASVWIESLDEKKQRIGTGSGFFVDDELVLTAFQVIDGASSLRVRMPDNRILETTTLAAWNRLQDWALLKVAVAAPKLERAKPKSWAVGDRCFSLDVPTEGNRVIVDEGITGSQSFAELGDRFNLSSLPTAAAIGAPVLNEYGDVIGVLGGNTFPGARRYDSGIFGFAGLREGALATPIESVPLHVSGPPKALSELTTAGEFVIPLTKEPELVYGVISDHFELKKGDFPPTRQPRTEFSRVNGHCEVLLVWNSRAKLRTELTLNVYNIHNQPVVQSLPVKLKSNPGQYVTTRWAFELANLKPSTYRIDVLEGSKPIWRTYFRLTE